MITLYKEVFLDDLNIILGGGKKIAKNCLIGGAEY